MLVTTARSAHCQRCTNCSRQYCTADYVHDSTKNKRKIRRDSEVHTPDNRQPCDVQNDWAENATSGESKCGQRQLTSRRFSTPLHTNQFGKHSNPAVSNTTTSASWRRFTETREHLYRLRKRATCSRSRKEPNRVVLCQACFSIRFYRIHWKTTFSADKKKGMWIYLSDHDHDCLTNLWFADGVLLFATSKEQLQKMLCDFKKSAENVGPRIHPEKTKILSNQSSLSSDTKKETEVDDKKTKNWQEEKAWDAWARRWRSCNKRRPKSRIDSG